MIVLTIWWGQGWMLWLLWFAWTLRYNLVCALTLGKSGRLWNKVECGQWRWTRILRRFLHSCFLRVSLSQSKRDDWERTWYCDYLNWSWFLQSELLALRHGCAWSSCCGQPIDSIRLFLSLYFPSRKVQVRTSLCPDQTLSSRGQVQTHNLQRTWSPIFSKHNGCVS